MGFDIKRFRDTFFQEAAEHVDAMEASLLSLQNGGGDEETLHAIFRCAHSMKAGAGTFGFAAMARFTHVLETLLDQLRNGEVTLSRRLLELLLRSVDIERSLLAAAANGDEPPLVWEEVVEELDRARNVPTAGTPEPAPRPPARPEGKRGVYLIDFVPGPEVFQIALDPFLPLRDLGGLGSLEATPDLSRLPALDQLDPEVCYLGWRLRLDTEAPAEAVRDAFAFFEDVSEVSIRQPEEARPGQVPKHTPGAAARPENAVRERRRDTSIRVATAKVDGLIDLVGELVIAQSMAAQIVHGFTPDRLAHLQESIAAIGAYTRELQERAMSIRMMPIGAVFGRFPRLVHDTARALGKEVSLEISGEDTELDKSVVEQIADPLTHLVRNAVDHGIETAEERSRTGKPATGVVRLSAYHMSGSVMVEVADDGRGLDAARIRAKAVERGLIGAGDELTDEQAHALIFRPGFSTAEAVTNLSGRGVGMDVVKKSVESLSGTVTVDSRPGAGSIIRIKLPLTLAVLDGLLVRVGDQTFVLPLSSIVESIRPRPEQARDVAGRGTVIVVRKEAVPLVRLGSVLGTPGAISDPAQGLVVIVEHECGRAALLVDELIGQQQVVIKSLETNFRRVEGVMGATILGDGRAALILDIAGLCALSRGGLGRVA